MQSLYKVILYSAALILTIFSMQKSTKYDANDAASIPNTYTALANLLLLGDDLSRVNTKAIVTTLKNLQQEDGR